MPDNNMDGVVMKKGLDAVIFDFDGVLVDSVEMKTLAFAELYRGYGETVQNKVVEYHLQNKGISRVHKFRYYQTDILGETVNEEGIHALCDQFSSLVKDKVISAAMIPGAEETLQFLHEHSVPMYVASGTPETELIDIINARKLQGYFKGIYGSPRTKTDILKDIILNNNYDALACIMVGDATEDYTAAYNNGCEFAGVAYQAPTELPGTLEILADMVGFTSLLRNRFDIG
jgi:phosphoglycolate phosphatase-like HAD superfamily hydrolase